jgi:hypothetical protein
MSREKISLPRNDHMKANEIQPDGFIKENSWGICISILPSPVLTSQPHYDAPYFQEW